MSGKDVDRGVLVAKGTNGQLTLEGSVVVIERKGALGFLTQGHKGAKRINIADITAIQFKEPGLLTSGYIQFSYQGGLDAKGGVFQAANDENSVMFTKEQRASFRAMLERVESLRNGGAAIASVADEIEKLAALRDRGILTDEEFVAKKRQLLGM